MAILKTSHLVTVLLCCCCVSVSSSGMQHGRDSARDRNRNEMDDAMMHPKMAVNRSPTGSRNIAAVRDKSPVLDREMMRRMDIAETNMHPRIPSAKKVNSVQRDFDVDGMHPRGVPVSRVKQPTGARNEESPGLDRNRMRRMDADEADMHPRHSAVKKAESAPRSPSKSLAKSPRESKQLDLDESLMHPAIKPKQKPRKSQSAPPKKMDDRQMHPHVAKNQPKENPAIDEVADDDFAEAALGPDFIHRFDIDDSMLHPIGGNAKVRRSAASRQMDMDESIMHPAVMPKQQPRKSRSKPPKKMDDRQMHPHVAKNQPKEDPAIDESDEDFAEAALGPDFIHRFDIDDSMLHPAGGKPKTRESATRSDERDRDDMDEELMHPRHVPRRQKKTAGDDRAVLGHAPVKRKEMDDAVMHPSSDRGKTSSRKSRSLLSIGPGYPNHASCKINWTFKLNCSSVSKALISQMQEWNGPDNCDNGGEKCLYELLFSNSTRVSGTHTTPVKKYVDDVSFNLTASSQGCMVYGFSTSETWYAYLDSGTNYCNLENLITGSKLDKSTGYTEKTDDGVCTQFTSADCDKY